MQISSTPSIAAAASQATGRTPIQTLGQNDFLKLLVTQMTSQDPLNPQKDSEFIAQMAQFSSLEQTKAMQADVAGLRSDQLVLQANALLGRTVEVQVGQNQISHGVVSAVQFKAGAPKLMVNGQSFLLGQVVSITPTGANN